jgi:hypothetical protein
MPKPANDKWVVDIGDGIWYDACPSYHGLTAEGIRAVEEKRSCRYVCEWHIIDSRGEIHESPMMLFWNDVSHPQGSNWMALYHTGGGWYVRDGITASRLPTQAYVSDDGEAVFSKHRHDLRSSRDGTITVDGGRSYTRLMGNLKCRRIWLLPQQGEMNIIDESAAILLLSELKVVA